MGEYKKLRLVLRILRYSILGILSLMTLLLLITFLSLPGTGDLKKPDFPGYLRVTDQGGAYLGNMDGRGEARSWFPLPATPLQTIRTTIFIEDAQFWYHRGLDLKQIYYALIENIALGSYKYGASTITQQLVKNIYLSREKTILRKLKELMLTLKIESKLSKQQIMEWYLNIVEIAPGVYGMENGARHYFDRSIASLPYAHQVLLCNLIAAPRHFVTNRLLLKKRITRITRKLRKFDRINMAQHRALSGYRHPVPRGGLKVHYPGLHRLLYKYCRGLIQNHRETVLKLSIRKNDQLLLEKNLASSPGIASGGKPVIWALYSGRRITAITLQHHTSGNSLKMSLPMLRRGLRPVRLEPEKLTLSDIIMATNRREILFSRPDCRLNGYRSISGKLPVK